jgi:hypothetical protein
VSSLRVERPGTGFPDKVTVDRVDENGQQIRVTLTIDVDAFAGENWRKILWVKDRPGHLVRRHLEVCVFSYPAAELRSGDVAIVGADSYAMCLTWEDTKRFADT